MLLIFFFSLSKNVPWVLNGYVYTDNKGPRAWPQLRASALLLGTAPAIGLASPASSAPDTAVMEGLEKCEHEWIGCWPFSIMNGTRVSSSSGTPSKSGSRKDAILSLNIQRGLMHWVPHKIPERWWPVELLTECGCSYHSLLGDTGLWVCVIFCLSTDCLSLKNPSRSYRSRLTPFSTFRWSCLPAAYLFILIFINCWASV